MKNIKFEILKLSLHLTYHTKQTKTKQTMWPLVRKRTIPTEQPSLVGDI
jgi:hypothetical protein